MNKILKIRELAPDVKEYVISAPDVAKNAQAGQFVIVIVEKGGERVPFTICDYDRDKGTITLLVQTVGYSTHKMAQLKEGDSLSGFTGPLGNPTDLDGYKKIALVGGGIGTAVIYPQAKKLKSENRTADVIIGARNSGLLMYEKELSENSASFYEATDDGSKGEKGFVTDILKRLIEEGKNYDCVFAVGPIPMMRAVCNLTKNYGIKTVVSMNMLMVDGTGMCGCCRLTVGGKVKYACVDGPEFDGHQIDFEEAMNRISAYKEHESEHRCKIRG